MSELINKYTAAHDRFIDALTRYYPLHERFLERESFERTVAIRAIIRELRVSLKEMAEFAHLRRSERQQEWLAAHPDAAKQRQEKRDQKKNELNNKSNQ